jgi:hypothetical protein
MKQNMIRLILLVLIGLMTVNTVNAGILLEVTPVVNVVPPGGTAIFDVTVIKDDPASGDEDADLLEILNLSVVDMAENPISWTNSFTPNLFNIGKYPDNMTRTSTLKLVVPDPFTNAVELQIKGEGFYETGLGSGIPDTTESGRASFAIFPISVYPVPELSTTILTSAGLLGLVFVSRKYKGT